MRDGQAVECARIGKSEILGATIDIDRHIQGFRRTIIKCELQCGSKKLLQAFKIALETNDLLIE
jgi:hypothetical protein